MRVLLGVTGSIAAYKAADLTSRLVKLGAEVRVVMTPSATRFVGPLTFEALTNAPVMTDALASGYSPEGVAAVEHIRWARWAEVAVIAPLTASTMGRLAAGIADDALGTVLLALAPEVPLLLCPAMNTVMWDHPLVQRNRRWLQELPNVRFVEPASARLACGEVGPGALAPTEDIAAQVVAAWTDARRGRLPPDQPPPLSGREGPGPASPPDASGPR